MSRRLKLHPDIVDDFFGRSWTIDFCGEEAAKKLGNRLDAADIARLRRELLTLYSSNFSSIDPGVVLGLPSGQQRQLLLIDRFIEPDISFEDASSTFTEVYLTSRWGRESPSCSGHAKRTIDTKVIAEASARVDGRAAASCQLAHRG